MKLLATLLLAGLSCARSQPFTLTDVQAHNTATSCWMAINNVVYDTTNYINSHPGGPTQITNNCGTEATAAYTAIGTHQPAKIATTTGITTQGAFTTAVATTATPTTATPTTAAAVATSAVPTAAATTAKPSSAAATTVAVPTTATPTTAKPTTLNPILACKNAIAALKAASMTCGFNATNTLIVTPTKFANANDNNNRAAATTAPVASTVPPTTSAAGTLKPAQAALVAVAQQFVNGVCPKAATCIAALTAAIKTATTTCMKVWNDQAQDDIATLQNLNTFVQVGCSTDPTTGAFCLPSFFTSAFQLDNNNIDIFQGYSPLDLLRSGKVISNTVLNAICTPCTNKVSAALQGLNAQVSVNTYTMYAAAVAAACIKDPTVAAGTQFCLNSLTGIPTTAAPTTAAPSASVVATTAAAGAAGAIAAAINAAGAAQQFAAKLNNDLCTPCFRLELNAIAQASTWATSIAGAVANNANNNLLDAECAVNPVTNQRCAASATQIQIALAWDIPQACKAALQGQACAPACAQLLQTVIAKNGCCFATFITALRDSIPALMGQTITNAQIAAFFTKCNVTAAQLAVCPTAQQPTQTTIAVINLNFAFYQANVTAVTKTLQQDIAATAGVSAASVTILSVKPLVGNNGGAVIVAAAVGGPTAADAAIAATAVTTAVTTGGMPTVATATLAVSATDPTTTQYSVSDPVFATSQDNAVVLTGATTDSGTTSTNIGLIIGVVVGGVVVLALVAFGVYKYISMKKGAASAATAGTAKQTAV